MKIVFVGLVLFIGYNSGVIVPSVVSKLLAINKTTPTSKANLVTDLYKVTYLRANEIGESNKSDLEKSNQIDEKELFQTATDKKNNLNERSFIFINQRYKTPLISQLYNSQPHNLNEPFPISNILSQVDSIPPCFEKVSSLKELFVPNIKIKGPMQSKYSPPMFKKLERKIISNNKDDKYVLRKMQESVQTKPSSLNKYFDKNVYQKTNKFNSENTMKPYQSDEIPQPMPSFARHRINYNYGFPSAGRVFHGSTNNEYEEITIKSLITDSVAADVSPLDFNDEDDNVLERYIKEALQKSYVNDVADIRKKCINCQSTGKTQTDDCECQDETVNPAVSNEIDRLFISNDDKQWMLNQ